MEQQRSVTFRILLIGLVLIFVNAYWVIQVEGIWHSNHASAMSLFWNSIFFLLLLVLFNIFVMKRFWPKKALTQGELIVAYVMMNIATALAGHDSLQLGIPGMQGFTIWFQAQNAGNGFDKFNHYFPDWIMVKDLDILRPVYYGSATKLLYTKQHLLAWAVPVAVWSGFILALGTVMICLNVFIRKQWMESEKLSYPIVQLPMAMTEGGGTVAFFRQKTFWAGMLVGIGLDVWNGLATLYPQIPLIPVRHDYGPYDLGKYVTSPPWNAMGSVPMPLYPFIVALGYFLPLDLCFSLWFFYLVKLGLNVLAAYIGIVPRPLSTFPYLTQQSFGAWGMIVLTTLWAARGHLKRVWITIWEPKSAEALDDSDEPLRYRTAAWLMVIALAYLIGFCLLAGMSWGIVLGIFAFYFLLSLGITRLRAELGPPAHEMAGNLNAPQFLTMLFGTQAVGGANIAMMSLFWWFTGRGYRTHPMPCQLEAMKMSNQAQTSPKGMGFAMAFALFFGALASYWAGLHLQYTAGVNVMTDHNWGQFQQTRSWVENPLPPDTGGMIATGFGALAALGMSIMRSRFVGWPLHPAGYAIALTFGAEYYWSCLVLAWILKWGILKFGGLKLNRMVLPFMFGLILGEYATGAFWSLLSTFLNDGRIINLKTYDFAPG
ncbi:MAG: hypothetical protein QM758_14920 [Armatimonas sp.]